MKNFLLAFFLLASFVAPASGQVTTLAVDIATGKFSWTPPTTRPMFYRMKCGTASGLRDLQPVEITALDVNGLDVTEMPVADVVTAPGEYFCAVISVNRQGTAELESMESNEVTFAALDRPGVPTNLLIQSQ